MNKLLLSALGASLLMGTASASAQRLTPKVDVPALVQNVQSNDSFRVNELEAEIRRLNGKVEELNFLLLQLQEKFRKMEVDNEGRFQDLEDKRSSVEDDKKSVAKAETKDTNSLGKPEPSGETESPDVKQDAIKKAEAPRQPKGEEPRALGTLTFDKDGNVIDTRPSENGAAGKKLSGLPGLFDDATDGAVEAAEFGATPKAVFKAGKAAYDARDFKRSQQAFAAHLKAWPKDPDAGRVKYYLGESYFWQKEYYRAADAHLDAHNNYPEADTAPDNLLALGLALAGLNQREVACATYAEVLNQYPETAPRLGERIKDEQAAARC